MATIEIGGHPVEMIANAATSYAHQRIFNEDFLKKQTAIEKMAKEESQAKGYNPEEPHESDLIALDVYKRLAFTMAMQAEHLGKEEELLRIGEVDYLKWLSEFENPDALEDAILDIIGVYSKQETPTAEEKKEPAPQTDP